MGIVLHSFLMMGNAGFISSTLRYVFAAPEALAANYRHALPLKTDICLMPTPIESLHIIGEGVGD